MSRRTSTPLPAAVGKGQQNSRVGRGNAPSDAGMVTAEFAVALPAVLVVATFCLGAVGLVLDQMRCTDAARAGARALARGDDPTTVRQLVVSLAPRGAHITLSRGERARVDVRAPSPAVLGPWGSAVQIEAFGEAVSEDGGGAP